VALYLDGVHYRCSADVYVPSLYVASLPCVTCNQRSINMKIIFNFTSANQKNIVVSLRRCSFSFISRKMALNDYAFDWHLTTTRLSYDCCIFFGGGESLWTWGLFFIITVMWNFIYWFSMRGGGRGPIADGDDIVNSAWQMMWPLCWVGRFSQQCVAADVAMERWLYCQVSAMYDSDMT
jgi:hypothetical protein